MSFQQMERSMDRLEAMLLVLAVAEAGSLSATARAQKVPLATLFSGSGTIPVRTLSERLVSSASQLGRVVHQRPCRSFRAFGSSPRSGSDWRRTSLLP